ncbi:PREDICTED: diuretic hormone 45 isoform X2 [Nicrophorus vespilloides]|nr:PREDICTED: diuretic hormone 45 isoform X2 [Nicrophorus vespilloides]XP_017768007.1 PREDICTED: diuretic hormone 45 isoform X2 [Nicrophorus vespilloides]
MNVPVYIVCAALIVAVNSEENPLFGRENEPMDREAMGYILPKLMPRYRAISNKQWMAPYYADSNNNNELDFGQEARNKRAGLIDGPSLSISNSLDVLRNRLLLEISRKKALLGANYNRNMLCRIGKRFENNKRRCEDSEKYVEDRFMV